MRIIDAIRYYKGGMFFDLSTMLLCEGKRKSYGHVKKGIESKKQSPEHHKVYHYNCSIEYNN